MGFLTGLLQSELPPTAFLTPLVFGLYGPFFLLFSWLTFRGIEGENLRTQLSRSADRSRLLRWLFISSPTSWATTVLVVGMSSVILLTTRDQGGLFWVLPICVVGVAGSWILMVGVMAIKYMRNWARYNSMAFPGDEPRAFSDFIYLSLQVSTTFSSADVALTQRPVRNLASLHLVLAFAYSTTIIAIFASLLITLAA